MPIGAGLNSGNLDRGTWSGELEMDKGSVAGVFLALAGITAGLLIEGGNLGQVLQPTAALIVFGGTLGAVLLQFPLSTVLDAFRSLGNIFAAPRKYDPIWSKQLVAFANKARRNGVVSLDADLPSIQDPFLKQTLMLAVDGTEPTDLRSIMRVNLESAVEDEERLPAVFESAGGFSPTIGILGAVLGLIQVMQHLDNIQEVGRRHCGCLCRHHLRRRHRQSVLPALRRQNAPAHPRRAPPPRNDARRRDLDSGRH